MNRRLVIGLTLAAWCLYVTSLFLPAADVDLSFGGGPQRVGDLEQGWEVLLRCVIPIYWMAVFPFVYLMVNVVFLLSVRRIWLHLDGELSWRRFSVPVVAGNVLTSFSALASWIAPLFVVGVGVGVQLQ